MTQAPARILVVDDDATFSDVVADLLQEMGHTAVVCNSPELAIGRAREAGASVAFVDLSMPVMNGIELAALLKQSNPDMQVVILTGQGDMASAIKGLQLGVFDYLQKQDLDRPRLERSVQQATEKARLMSENRLLLEQVTESNRLLTALHDVSTSMAGQPHLDRLLPKLTQAARDLTGAAEARVMLFDRTSADGYVVATASGAGAGPILGARLQQAEGIATWVMQRDEPLVLEDASAHARYSHRCDEVGARPGFLCVPVLHGDVTGALLVAGRTRPFGAQERDLLQSLGRQGAVAIDNAVGHEKAVNFFTHASEILVSFLEQMDVHLSGHSRSVARLADMLTRRLGLPDAERRNVHFAALLHDIGKVRVDPDALRATGALTEEQRTAMRRHPAHGLEMIRPVSVWEEVLPMIHAHHERWDGEGYPLGQAGDAIPLGARVIAVADTFDVMLRGTPWQAARTTEDALAELEKVSGSQLDPLLVRLFVADYRKAL